MVTIEEVLKLALSYHLGEHLAEPDAVFSIMALVAVVATVLV